VGTEVARREHALSLLRPLDDAPFAPDSGAHLAWLEERGAAHYRVELTGAEDKVLLHALVPAGAGGYAVPPWLAGEAGGAVMRWRVVALDARGRAMRASEWRTLRVQP
jgi:hypothetical protein